MKINLYDVTPGLNIVDIEKIFICVSVGPEEAEWVKDFEEYKTTFKGAPEYVKRNKKKFLLYMLKRLLEKKGYKKIEEDVFKKITFKNVKDFFDLEEYKYKYREQLELKMLQNGYMPRTSEDERELDQEISKHVKHWTDYTDDDHQAYHEERRRVDYLIDKISGK